LINAGQVVSYVVDKFEEITLHLKTVQSPEYVDRIHTLRAVTMISHNALDYALGLLV
jgi:hypothetical protein